MANKYLGLIGARPTEVLATTASTGAPDAGKIIALDGAGKLDQSMMPTGVGEDAQMIPASENLAAGDFVNVWVDAGATKVRKADATAAGKEATGFVLSAVASGQNAKVYFDGSNTSVTGLTPGVRHYLSATTPGAATAAPPNASGNVVQFLGVTSLPTRLPFNPAESYILA